MRKEAMKLALQYIEANAETKDEHEIAIGLRQAIAEAEKQEQGEPVANIRTWHKNGEQHAELLNWDRGIETLPDGLYDLYTTPQPKQEQGDKHDTRRNY
jgi:hypothetical protein